MTHIEWLNFLSSFWTKSSEVLPLVFSQEAPLEWEYVGGSRSNSDFQHAGDTGCTFKAYTLHQTHQWKRRGRGGRSHSHLHNTTGTIANLSHVISSALDLWPLSRAVLVLKATCHCLNCLSKASLEGHRVCRRNMLLQPLLVNPPLVPSMCCCLCVYVYHCLLSPLVFYACCSLARQWPLRMKCRSGQYVSKPLGWKKAGWQQKAVCLERKRRLEEKERALENNKDNACNKWGGVLYVFHCNNPRIKNQQDLSSTQQPAFPNSDITSEPSESECPDLFCLRDLVEQGSATALCMHQPHRCSPNWGTSSIQCMLAPLPLHHRVWRRKVGRGTRLMMVLTAYLSSGWRVMRHLSNLNIFHWAVMALSPGPHVCVCVHVCVLAPLCVTGSAFEC